MRTSIVTASAAILAVALADVFVHAEPRSIQLPDETVQFKPGPGADVAEANCKTCHSIDYIQIQPPKKGKEFWSAEVHKMIKVFGAPIEEADAAKIAEYLAASY
jgi:mono/diheme cytochrome c family protein